MKKLFITVLLLITCIGSIIAASRHFHVQYADKSVVYYDTKYNETWFHIIRYRKTDGWYQEWRVWDESMFDDSRKKSREDFDRIVDDINATHPGAIKRYEKYTEGQDIVFDEDKIKKIY